MKTVYYPEDDILVIRLDAAPVVKEVSQSWHVNVGYDGAGKVVEIVVLEASAQGAYPTTLASELD